MRTLTPEPRSWEALADRGAHFVLADATKRPIGTAWQKKPRALADVLKHVAKKLPVGVIPSSLDAVVIDVDEGGEAAVAAVIEKLGPPITWTVSKRAGGFHIWYRSATCARNRQWALGDGAGDVRGGHGFVILWDAEKIADGLAHNFDDALPVDLSKLDNPDKPKGRRRAPAAATGDRNNALNRKVFAAAQHSDLVKIEAAKKEALDAGLPPGEVTATAASAQAAAVNVPVFQTKDDLALMAALKNMGMALRYNLRKQNGEIRNGTGTWEGMTDRSAGFLRAEIARKFRYDTDKGPRALYYGEASWALYTNAVMYRFETDPFLVWLEAVPPWDGVERVNAWLSDCFEAEGDPALVAWAAQFIFLGAVWRAFQPGTKLDEMVVLSGPQGIGKSSALQLVLPPELPGLFADGLHLADFPQQRAEALQGRVIVEAAEMAGKDRAELESLKVFLSRQDDGVVRMAYRRNPENTPRRAIIVGTTNAADPLPNDATGLRRFVVVRLRAGNVKELAEYMDRNRVQLWAEAVALYREGVEAWLPPALKQAQTEVNELSRRRDDLLEDKLDSWIEREAGEPFTLERAALAVGFVQEGAAAALIPQRDQKRLANALTQRGFAKKRERFDGKLRYRWQRGA